MKCVKYDHEFAQDLRDKVKSGVSQKSNGESRTRASKQNNQERKRSADHLDDNTVLDSDSNVEFGPSIASGSSSDIRRSARHAHPKIPRTCE